MKRMTPMTKMRRKKNRPQVKRTRKRRKVVDVEMSRKRLAKVVDHVVLLLDEPGVS